MLWTSSRDCFKSLTLRRRKLLEGQKVGPSPIEGASAGDEANARVLLIKSTPEFCVFHHQLHRPFAIPPCFLFCVAVGVCPLVITPSHRLYYTIIITIIITSTPAPSRSRLR